MSVDVGKCQAAFRATVEGGAARSGLAGDTLVFTGAGWGRLDAAQLAVNELGVEPTRVAMAVLDPDGARLASRGPWWCQACR